MTLPCQPSISKFECMVKDFARQVGVLYDFKWEDMINFDILGQILSDVFSPMYQRTDFSTP